MNRRGVLLGLGTAAAGSGAIFGSGAFTTLQADRNITIQLAEDENADIALTDTAITSDLVTNSTSANDNQIEFDFDSGGSGVGINSNATARFGNSSNTTDVPGADLDSDVDVGAFKIVNNTDGTYDISVEIQFTGSGDVNSFSVFLDKTNGDSPKRATAESDGNTKKATINDVAKDEEVQAALEIDTNDSIDQFDGTITITAERPNPTAS